ncbi:MAG: hypothetical protein HRU20_16195 [Pseudomonadales bacterium]|nr:hypothetical protein [Pseudomonadales bacterium]
MLLRELIEAERRLFAKKRFFIAAAMLAASVGLSSCGGDSNDGDSELQKTGPQSTTLNIVVGEGGEQAVIQLPSSDQATIAPLPLPRSLSAGQQMLSASGHDLDVAQRWNYQSLLPKPQLFCDKPEAKSFARIAQQLGGFRKASPIYVEPDATTPTLLDGIEPSYRTDGLFEVSADAASDLAVTIQRPDTVKRQGNSAFYLSDAYGLIQLNFVEDASQAVKVSCAMALPGRLKNFVSTADRLLVLTESLQGKGTGVIQFAIGEDGLEYQHALYFPDEELVDARLFNDTLALYVKVYEAEDVQTQRTARSSPVVDELSIAAYPQTRLLNYQLKIIDTGAELVHSYSEIFAVEDAAAAEFMDPGERWSSSFNPFVSASGEYLVVSENLSHSYIDHYETKHYSRCTDWQSYTTAYEYCRVNWKRIENPDYQPLPPSGVLNCQGDLLSCLRISVPRVNRYLYIADGQTCHSGERTRYSCTQRVYGSYQRPVYQHDGYSKLHIFRFKDGEFYKLDDQLATLSEDMTITQQEDFRLTGALRKHDHLQFHGDFLYAVTHDNAKNQLQTLMVQGNSAVLLNQMSLSGASGDIAVRFTRQKVYISEAQYQYGQTLQWSDMQTISLADPAHPVIDKQIRIPTSLDQLLFGDDVLLGLGIVSISSESGTDRLASISLFSSEGLETNSLLLGADYRYNYADFQHDDQSVHLDQANQRLLVPYSSHRPHDAANSPPGKHRLTVAGFSGGSLIEEHTFSLPAAADRSLSIAEPLAFVFSRDFIHSLTKLGGWQQQRIFDGELPVSIYYSRKQALHVQKFSRIDQTLFKLIDSAEDTSAALLDTLSVPKDGSGYCVPQRVYFDRDRVLIVQEKPGVYFSYQDCADRREDNELQLSAYRLSRDGFQPIEDEAQLLSLYQQIQWDLHCITDINNLEGKRIDSLPEGSELSCYTAEQYWQIRDTAAQPL